MKSVRVRRGRPGRRPGESGTREAILAAARLLFAEHGYDGASVRGIAAEAHVDPALVHHFFGTKTALFVAAFDLSYDPGEALPRIVSQDMDRAGEGLVRFFVTLWEDEAARAPLLAMMRSAVSEPGSTMLRQFLGDALLPMAAAIGSPEAPYRAALCGSLIAGLAFARYIVGIEPLASAPPEALVAAVAPVMQHYLTGRLEGTAA